MINFIGILVGTQRNADNPEYLDIAVRHHAWHFSGDRAKPVTEMIFVITLTERRDIDLILDEHGNLLAPYVLGSTLVTGRASAFIGQIEIDPNEKTKAGSIPKATIVTFRVGKYDTFSAMPLAQGYDAKNKVMPPSLVFSSGQMRITMQGYIRSAGKDENLSISFTKTGSPFVRFQLGIKQNGEFTNLYMTAWNKAAEKVIEAEGAEAILDCEATQSESYFTIKGKKIKVWDISPRMFTDVKTTRHAKAAPPSKSGRGSSQSSAGRGGASRRSQSPVDDDDLFDEDLPF